jgi:hypothetical protein
MDQALLDALALDADQLLEWIDHYPVFSFVMAPVDGPGEKITASEPGAAWSRRRI